MPHVANRLCPVCRYAWWADWWSHYDRPIHMIFPHELRRSHRPGKPSRWYVLACVIAPGDEFRGIVFDDRVDEPLGKPGRCPTCRQQYVTIWALSTTRLFYVHRYVQGEYGRVIAEGCAAKEWHMLHAARRYVAVQARLQENDERFEDYLASLRDVLHEAKDIMEGDLFSESIWGPEGEPEF